MSTLKGFEKLDWPGWGIIISMPIWPVNILKGALPDQLPGKCKCRSQWDSISQPYNYSQFSSDNTTGYKDVEQPETL